MEPAARPRSRSGATRLDRSRLALAAVAVFGLLPVLMVFVGSRMAGDFSEQHRIRVEVRAIRTHRSALRDVFTDLLQAETGQRGYLMTGRPAYLTPYLRVKSVLPGRLDALVEASRDDRSRSDARRLATLGRRKLEELGRTVDLAEAGRPEQAFAIVRTDAGQRYMDEIRGLTLAGRARDDADMQRLSRAADAGEAATAQAALTGAGAMMLTLVAATAIVVLSFRDRRRALQRVRESELHYRLVTDHATDVIIQVDPRGVFTFVSPSSAAVLGYRPEELIGRRVFDLAHPDDVARLLEQNAAYLAAGPGAPGISAVSRMIRKDGRAIWMEGRPKLVYGEDGQATAAFDVLRDVTRSREMEIALETARREALAAAEAKGEFLANMSHELRTPLTSIIGYGNLLADDPALPAPLRPHLGRIRTASAALLATVNDILDFSKLEAGQVEIRRRPSDLRALVGAVEGMVAGQAEAKGLALEVSVQAPAGPVEIDEDRLRQVLLNLLSNAVKFTEQGRVRLELVQAAGRLSCRIADTGPGVPEEKQGQLFLRFSQVDGSTTRRHGGTGLGLAICKGLVEAMDGRIGVESRPGEGSTFWFDIAAPVVEAVEKRVLVVDDGDFTREIVASMLRAQGYAVHTAETAEAALEQAGQAAFDIVLVDRHAAGVDGPGFVQALRSAQGLNAEACLLAYARPGAALEKGFDGEIAQPVTAQALGAAVDAVRARSGPERAVA